MLLLSSAPPPPFCRRPQANFDDRIGAERELAAKVALKKAARAQGVSLGGVEAKQAAIGGDEGGFKAR